VVARRRAPVGSGLDKYKTHEELSRLTIVELLGLSPWPLSVGDIATALGVDEGTAAMALKLLADAGKARYVGTGWEIIRTPSASRS
jgi:predicted transcriptional regulator